ncbi:hypothetical protein AEAC466_17100 [Asticcacaulis sp. AC466]|uniref:DUF1961 family protein n=1 Tax=Asticcacaulis sp. AC466 TaxID=1282362 RepID=UPI0003C3BB65|nr:DUF1961 family protein [Asticcacaulis sp. AC466]ESQ82584.1 hypothetical protein AEAC466_17100 [Asticcacaulis sp. AC466]
MFDRRRLLLGAAGLLAGPAVAAGDLVYANPLKRPSDIAGFRLEGEAIADFDIGQLRLRNRLSSDQGQASNFVFWCPEVLPDHIEISWNFTALEEPGLCILFFAAQGLVGAERVDLFDTRLKSRAGIYDQYTQSDVSALQIAYFRRRWESERAFHLCNLRRAPGFELLAQGADPLPDVADATPPYRICLRKSGADVAFFINDLPILNWRGDPAAAPTNGYIGFRQMAPLSAMYSDLEVRRLVT